MSAFTLDKLPGEPIVHTRLSADFRMDRDLEPYSDQITRLLDSLAEPVCYVADVREVRLTLNDMIAGTNSITRGANAYLRHPNLKAIFGVIDSKMIELAAKGLNSQAFGFVAISVYRTPEEAFEAARAMLEAEQR